MSTPWQNEKYLAQRYLYLAVAGELCKIGVSKKPKARVSDLSGSQPHKLRLAKSWPKAGSFEPIVHTALAPLRERGEWFRCGADLAQWVCESALDGKRETATVVAALYRELKRLEIHPERRRLTDDLHDLGFDTIEYLVRINTARAAAERPFL